jgi:regulator of protease activity HflC (stomatin/prohibitin superfamily)
MADVTKLLFLRHLRGTPTVWVRFQKRGRTVKEGTGQSFWYRPLTAVLSEVPVDDRELPLMFHARTADFADVTVQATVTYRIADPALAATRLDFSVDPYHGQARARPLDQVATLLTELAQQPALDLLARVPLADVGAEVVSARVVAIRPEPEMERSLQTPTREAVQQDADKATYARRAQAVEQERAIAENELQNKIELARREQQLVEQKGANDRRRAELTAAADLAAAQGEAEKARTLAAAQADRVRDVGAAEADAEAARMAVYRDLPTSVLHALALRELAGQLPEIGQLTVTPDLLSGALARLAEGQR